MVRGVRTRSAPTQTCFPVNMSAALPAVNTAALAIASETQRYWQRMEVSGHVTPGTKPDMGQLPGKTPIPTRNSQRLSGLQLISGSGHWGCPIWDGVLVASLPRFPINLRRHARPTEKCATEAAGIAIAQRSPSLGCPVPSLPAETWRSRATQADHDRMPAADDRGSKRRFSSRYRTQAIPLKRTPAISFAIA